jgi:hypothetical protein
MNRNKIVVLKKRCAVLIKAGRDNAVCRMASMILQHPRDHFYSGKHFGTDCTYKIFRSVSVYKTGKEAEVQE